MVKKWVTSSFKEILSDNCQAYVSSNDLGKNKDRTALVNFVANEIRTAATAGDRLPDDLNKVSSVCKDNLMHGQLFSIGRCNVVRK
jgi:hypothetical protein